MIHNWRFSRQSTREGTDSCQAAQQFCLAAGGLAHPHTRNARTSRYDMNVAGRWVHNAITQLMKTEYRYERMTNYLILRT